MKSSEAQICLFSEHVDCSGGQRGFRCEELRGVEAVTKQGLSCWSPFTFTVYFMNENCAVDESKILSF